MNSVSGGDSDGRKSGLCSIKLGKCEAGVVAFGITSAINNIRTGKWVLDWKKTGQTYYYHNYGHIYDVSSKGAMFTGSGWNEEDIILMEWNMDHCIGNVKFHKNNEYIGCMPIVMDLMYYPFACSGSGRDVEIEIL